jgi:hypothetical protein
MNPERAVVKFMNASFFANTCNESWPRIRVFLPKNRPLTCAGSLQGCAGAKFDSALNGVIFKIGHRSKKWGFDPKYWILKGFWPVF